MSGATLVSIQFHYILKEGIQGILPCFLTAHASVIRLQGADLRQWRVGTTLGYKNT